MGETERERENARVEGIQQAFSGAASVARIGARGPRRTKGTLAGGSDGAAGTCFSGLSRVWGRSTCTSRLARGSTANSTTWCTLWR